jgi:hypothetical protein
MVDNMKLKEIDWNAIDEDDLFKIKAQFGEKITSMGISLYGRDYSNYEIYNILNKMISDTTE